ncbi:glycosyltransferase family 4 protein [Marinilongibacter aquaticus]|uniref:glycosyltransferase family 4 protein n=1 Tax=Marinilongibacter aquaticus TaxID=2975157 RepID=UPI0021BD67F8|nr:glycosyltransferase family 4 protein [Marinilongibacter aquaticus]UBM57646.1 glycosyltransferase family 4 protein [Marinilongibacter aquaticus]
MKKKVLLIENFGEDFFRARLPFVKFLSNKGYRVFALIPEGEYADNVRREGVEVITYKLDRRNKSVLQILRLARIYRRIIVEHNFDITHSFRFQPNLIHSFASIFANNRVVLHVTGLGIAFSISSIKYWFYRNISRILYLFQFLIADTVIVQNPDDIDDFFLTERLKRKVVVIKGSGVDIEKFCSLRETFEERVSENLTFVCVTRLIWEKGIFELTQAFKQVIEEYGSGITLNIIGWVDEDNPRAVDNEFIKLFESNNQINFLGKRDGVLDFLRTSDVFIYPTYYREGIPRGILEALAVGLPIVTTSTPGCNLTVIEGVNGFFVQPKSVDSLVAVLHRILLNRGALKGMGNKSRELAVSTFAESVVFTEIEKEYLK